MPTSPTLGFRLPLNLLSTAAIDHDVLDPHLGCSRTGDTSSAILSPIQARHSDGLEARSPRGPAAILGIFDFPEHERTGDRSETHSHIVLPRLPSPKKCFYMHNLEARSVAQSCPYRMRALTVPTSDVPRSSGFVHCFLSHRTPSATHDAHVCNVGELDGILVSRTAPLEAHECTSWRFLTRYDPVEVPSFLVHGGYGTSKNMRLSGR
ncbi:hypothetical protein C8Q79DRAFT_526500 [Trametes meyenii]|nr:hypothetical protein C8Q79DRAFT_526500 [Trametes meyenii]